jgi:nitrogen fixation protein NifU and related proteins
MVEYSKKLMENFLQPKNMGEIKDADVVGEVGNPVCGDIIKVYLKIDVNSKKEKYIKDIKFKTLGCAAAIATSSMITELAKGKTLEQAKKITNNDVAKQLGGLPPIKMHCSNLAADALQVAINKYLKSEKK